MTNAFYNCSGFLNSTDFIRAQRSYIVNWRKISRIEDGVAVIGKHRVPLGESYRETLLARLPML